MFIQILLPIFKTSPFQMILFIMLFSTHHILFLPEKHLGLQKNMEDFQKNGVS